MSSLGAWGIGLGALFGLGVWIILTTLPSFRSASLQRRVAHMVADISPQAYADVTQKSSAPLPQFDFGMRSLKASLVVMSEKFAGPADALQLDLARAGSALRLFGGVAANGNSLFTLKTREQLNNLLAHAISVGTQLG